MRLPTPRRLLERLLRALALGALGVAAAWLGTSLASVHFAPGWGAVRIVAAVGGLFAAAFAFVGVGVALGRALGRRRVLGIVLGVAVAAPPVGGAILLAAMLGVTLGIEELDRDTREVYDAGLVTIYEHEVGSLCFGGCEPPRIAASFGPLPILRGTDFTAGSPRLTFTELGDFVRVEDGWQCVDIDRFTGAWQRC